MNKSEQAWTTGDEIKFVEMISSKDNKSALNGYAASIGKRKKWGRIDKAAVIDAVAKAKAEA